MSISTKITNSRFGVLCTIPGLIALVILIIYPVFYNIVVSLYRYNNILPLSNPRCIVSR